VSLGFHRPTGFEVLAHPPHGGNTIAEAGGNFARAFALVVKVKYPLTHRNRNGFHANTLPPLQPRGKLHHLCKRSNVNSLRQELNPLNWLATPHFSFPKIHSLKSRLCDFDFQRHY
jgi:hypothetical protein